MNTRRRVVFVLGAGASKPYNFPLGAELRDRIILRGMESVQIYESIGYSAHYVQQFLDELGESGVDSVDQFIEYDPERREKLGKALIAFHLSQNENPKAIRRPPDPDKPDRRWYQFLFAHLFEDVKSIAQFPTDLPVSFLTFNYDRSLDFWLMGMVIARYCCSADRARAALEPLSVVHLHGTLGGSPLREAKPRSYEAATNPDTLQRCIDGIHVAHAAKPDSAEWNRAHVLLSRASHVVFLGFSYGRDNVQRLQLGQHCVNRFARAHDEIALQAEGVTNRADVMGTCLGMTPSEIKENACRRITIATESNFIDQDALGWLRNNVHLLRPE